MKTKKIVWGFLITMIMIGCSTDDTEIIEEQVQLNAKNFKQLDPIDIIPEGPVLVTRDLGMPIEEHDLSEDGIIKIQYYTNNSHTRFNIRKEFHEKYPSLVLVLSLSNPSDVYDPNVEYWFLGEVNGISIHKIPDTNITLDREEDDPLNNFPSSMSLYQTVIQDITNSELIDLF